MGTHDAEGQERKDTHNPLRNTKAYENISVTVRRRSLLVLDENPAVCVWALFPFRSPPLPSALASSSNAASSDTRALVGPTVRRPLELSGGRSVSDPERGVRTLGVVAVLEADTGATFSFTDVDEVAEIVRLRVSRCWRPFSADTETVDGREKVTLFFFADVEVDSPESFLSIGNAVLSGVMLLDTVCGVSAVVALEVEILKLGFARTVMLEAVDTLRRLPFSFPDRLSEDSDGSEGRGVGIESGGSERCLSVFDAA